MHAAALRYGGGKCGGRRGGAVARARDRSVAGEVSAVPGAGPGRGPRARHRHRRRADRGLALRLRAALDHLATTFRRFAERECRGSSPLYEALALATAGDPELRSIAAAAR